jgi:Flp pilus assembly protein TadD
VGLLAAVTGTLLAFIGCLFGTRVFDDFHSVFANPSLRAPENLLRFFSDPSMFSGYGNVGSYRPVTLTSYALTFLFCGDSAIAFHAGNLIIHLLVVMGLFVLFRTLFLRSDIPHPVLAAGVGATLFGIHPAAGQVVHYISSRSESLAFLGVAVASAFHIRSLDARLSTVQRLLAAAGTLFGVAFALGSKETGVLAALMLPAVHFAARPQDGRHRWDGALLLAPPLMLVGLYAKSFLFPEADAGAVDSALLGPGLETGSSWTIDALRANAVYWQIALWPQKLAMFRELPSSEHATALAVVAGAVLLLGLVASLVAYSRKDMRLWGLAGLLFLAPLVPYLFQRLNLAVNENRVYPILAGLALAGGLLVELLWRRWRSGRGRRGLLAVLALVGLLFMARDWRASWIWASETRLWENAVRVSPGSGDIRAGLGVAYMRLERWADAERELLAALEFPGWQRFVVLDNLGIAAYQMGRNEDALNYFRRAFVENPDSVEVVTNLGGVLLEQGNEEEALPFFLRAVALVPGYCSGQVGLISALRKLGRSDECRRRFLLLPSHCRGDSRLNELRDCIPQAADG